MPKATPDVLFIEPDFVLAKSYMTALQTQNIHCSWEANAEEAIVKIDALHPKVIVLELQLRGHNGIEFLHELRSYADWQSIPVVINSVVPESESGMSPEIRTQLHVTDFCYKPRTDIEHLCNVVKGLL